MKTATFRSLLLCAIALLGHLAASTAVAEVRTQNFVVYAPAGLDDQVARFAEHYRKKLAGEWLGYEMPNWASPCPIQVKIDSGCGGQTSFMFNGGEVFDWDMQIQGTPERILDSVLPHEILHTVFASHFRQPLPRWADEGAAASIEHPAEQRRWHAALIQALHTKRGVPFSVMLPDKEYPPDFVVIYAQGHSLAKFLLHHEGKRKYVAFLVDVLGSGDWPTGVKTHYGYGSVGELQSAWLEWVKRGSPAPSNIQQVSRQANYQGLIFDQCQNGYCWQRRGQAVIVNPPQVSSPVSPPYSPPAVTQQPCNCEQASPEDVANALIHNQQFLTLILNAMVDAGTFRGMDGANGTNGSQGPPGRGIDHIESPADRPGVIVVVFTDGTKQELNMPPIGFFYDSADIDGKIVQPLTWMEVVPGGSVPTEANTMHFKKVPRETVSE